MRSTRRLAAALRVASACGAEPRFVEAPVVWRVAGDKDIPEPEKYEDVRYLRSTDILVVDRLERTLSLPDDEPARDINALAHPWMSYSHLFDPEYVVPSMLSFGLWKRP